MRANNFKPLSQASGSRVVVIDCDSCVRQHTQTCDDCVVTFICDRHPGGGVVVDVAEFHAMRRLSDGGLLPHLRHVDRAG